MSKASAGEWKMSWNYVREINSKDKNVSKFVFEREDAIAEAVLYKYPTYNERTVICCSTQSGCPVGCRFCGAGDSFVRSLTEHEILAQPVELISRTGIDPSEIKRLQIMFMSMGEPLLNMNQLFPAIKTLNKMYPNAALLISTSAPRVDYKKLSEISKEIRTIGLQFSIHESTDEKRNKLIPFKAKLSLKEIAQEGYQWFVETKRRPFFNYCVKDNNNSIDDVLRLRKLFNSHVWEATISVVCERDEHVAAANERQRKLAENFMQKMRDAGFSTRMFDPAGQDDIGGGCGQLWFVQDWMKQNNGVARRSVGAGHPIVHAPKR